MKQICYLSDEIEKEDLGNKQSCPTQIAADLAGLAAKMTFRSEESRFSNGGVLQTRQAAE